jgi:hypothetical protein
MRDILLIIHILALGLWIGASVVGLTVNPRINPRASAVASDHWHLTVGAFKRYLYIPAYLTVLVTGVLLIIAVEDSPYGLTEAFMLIGYLAVLIGAWLTMIYFARQSSKAAAAYDAGDTQTAATIEQKIAIGQYADIAVIVIATVAMVSKWGI